MTCTHHWVEAGGTNAGCDEHCICSVPVFECRLCGDSDYGNNIYARSRVQNCKWHEAKQAQDSHYADNPSYGAF